MTEVEKLKAQLEIAVEVLKYYKNRRLCQKALEKIKELDKSSKKVIDNKKNGSIIEDDKKIMEYD